MQNFRKILRITAISASMVVVCVQALANQQIRVVGSSTVYPFVTVVSENFARTTKNSAPIVESTGTGGGFKLFCAQTGAEAPDLVNASRAITSSESALCNANKVGNITPIKIGYDGIILANSISGLQYSLTKKQIFLALAKNVPSGGKLVPNPYKKWNDIDKSLPNEAIEVYGPPPTSGTRDAFVELVMEQGCHLVTEMLTIVKEPNNLKDSCKVIREDGAYVEAGENDNLIVQKLKSNPHALGIFGYSYLDQNLDTIKASIIDGVTPNFETITSDKYSASRPLYVYLRNANLKTTKGLADFIKELVSDKALSMNGYLVVKGLIPLSEKELKQVQDNTLKALQ